MSLITNKESEYKVERANVPTRFALGQLKLTYMWLKSNDKWNAKMCLISARDYAVNEKEFDDIKSVYDLLDTPEKAMARIAEILTRGGRIYDEYSEFLKSNGGENELN